MKLPIILSQIAINVALALSSDTVVDLGYTLHRGFIQSTKTGTAYLNFSNIRYGAPPTGPRRFMAPDWPPTDRTIQEGLSERNCPQALPGWINTAYEVIGQENLTSPWPFSIKNIPPVDPRTTEDCLFMDILVSESVYNKRHTHSGSAVLVWIHGGGYVQGYKTQVGNGAQFIQTSEGNQDSGIVYVAINYRLGVFGWLGNTPRSPNAVSNAGLLDQRLALMWIQKHIHKFGGNPTRVTVMGESAGAGAIMHHLVAYGGTNRDHLFQRAILQSPFVQDTSFRKQIEQVEQIFQFSNVSTFSELREAPSARLQTANALVVGNARPYGSFEFGPTVDGELIPDLAIKLLAQARFDRNISIMAGHNLDEGSLFSSPYIKSNHDYEYFLNGYFPGVSSNVSSYMANHLYPAIFDKSEGYVNQTGRVAATISDSTIICNVVALHHAYGNESFAYRFSVPPALHGDDVAYTFYDSSINSTINATLASIMQGYFLNFAVSGSPNAKGLPNFPNHRKQEEEDFNNSNVGPLNGTINTSRCDWWQRGLYSSTLA